MKDTYQQIYQDFCNNTKSTFYINAVAILLIFLFIIVPTQSSDLVASLKPSTNTSTNTFTNVIARLLIIGLLSYSLYTNIVSSNSLLDIDSIFTSPSLAIVRNNFLLNSVFSLLILSFIVYIFYDFIR